MVVQVRYSRDTLLWDLGKLRKADKTANFQAQIRPGTPEVNAGEPSTQMQRLDYRP